MNTPVRADPDNDDLTTPDFLRRTGPRKTDQQLRTLLASPGWAPFRSRGEQSMSKINTVIENRDAPVNVTIRLKGDAEIETKNFNNMEEFEAWYDPKMYKFIGSTNGPEFTDISVDAKESEMKKTKKVAAKKVAAKKVAAKTKKDVPLYPDYNGKTISIVPIREHGKGALDKKDAGFTPELYIRRKKTVEFDQFIRFYPDIAAFKALVKAGRVTIK